MPSADPALVAPAAAPPRVYAFPDKPSAADQERIKQRRVLLPKQPTSAGGAGGAASAAAAAPARDPLSVALPPASEVVVAELQPLLATPLGRMLEGCFRLEADVKESGFSLSDFERIAVVGDSDENRLVVFTGNLARTVSDAVKDRKDPVAYGDEGRIYSPTSKLSAPLDPAKPAKTGKPQPLGGSAHLGVWRDKLLFMSESRAAIEQAMDRLDGKSSTPSFPESEAFGLVYGEMTARRLANLMPAPLRANVQDSSLRVRFHVATDEDVLISARAYGAQDAVAVGKSLASGIIDARARAEAAGHEHLAELLGTFSVGFEPAGFRLRLALPLALFEEAFGECAKLPSAQPQKASSGG